MSESEDPKDTTEESTKKEPSKGKSDDETTKEKTDEKSDNKKTEKKSTKEKKGKKSTPETTDQNAKDQDTKDQDAEKDSSKPKKKKKSKRRSIPEGRAYITASYNNTIVTLTDPAGQVIAWASAGSSGFKGTRKSTPYAAQVAAENAYQKSRVYGLEKVRVFVKGIGSGREQALRGLASSGLQIETIIDTTPTPHNGCRPPRVRRT